MIRRSPARTALVALMVAAALSGCATFTDDDVAARVGDVELSNANLAALLRDQVGDDEIDRVSMQSANEIVTAFVLDQAIRADLARAGVPVEGADSSTATTFTALQESTNAAFQTWQASPPPPVAADTWQALYQRGPRDSAITCTQHVLVNTAAEADEVLEQLDDGAPFADVATEYSFDPGSAEQGGVLPCSSTNQFASSYVAEYVEATLDAEVGEVVGPVRSQFGFHVIRVRPFDDLDVTGELDPLLNDLAVRFQVAADDLDIHVDPRYGTFEGARGVVTLG